jgi:methylglyoxal synthase
MDSWWYLYHQPSRQRKWLLSNLERQKNLQLTAKLKHGTKIKVIKFIEGPCGGDVYIEAKMKGRTIRGWTNSEDLFFLTR